MSLRATRSKKSTGKSRTSLKKATNIDPNPNIEKTQNIDENDKQQSEENLESDQNQNSVGQTNIEADPIIDKNIEQPSEENLQFSENQNSEENTIPDMSTSQSSYDQSSGIHSFSYSVDTDQIISQSSSEITYPLLYSIVSSINPLLKSQPLEFFFENYYKTQENSQNEKIAFDQLSSHNDFIKNALRSFGYECQINSETINTLSAFVTDQHRNYSFFLLFFKTNSNQHEWVFWRTKYDWKFIILNEETQKIRRMTTSELTSLIDNEKQKSYSYLFYINKKHMYNKTGD